MARPIPFRRFALIQIAATTILPVVIIALLIWLFMMPQMRTNISLQHQSLARAIAGEIRAHLMGGERQLMALADVVGRQGVYSAAQLTALLDAGCGKGELFETIYIATNNDAVISSVGLARTSRSRREDLQEIDISGHHFFRVARQQKKTVWSETFLSTVSSHLAVAVAVPLPDRVIVGEITLNNLSELISHLPVEAGLLTLVLDRQGRIVADSQRKRWGQQPELAALPASRGQNDPAPVSQPFQLDGVHLVGSMLDVDDLGWKILVAQPYRTAFKPLRVTFLMVAAGLPFSLMVALALAWIQAKRLSRLVAIYVKHAKSIAKGEYKLQWPPTKTIEYRDLGESLRTMAEKIRMRERQLMASETHMRITLDSIGDAVLVTDTGGMVTRLNPMAEKLTGWPSSDAVGRQLAEVFKIVNNSTRQPADNPVEKVLASGKIAALAMHTLLIARDGREYQIADSGAPIRHPDGRIDGVVLVFRDVTERYAQERKIRENEAHLRKEIVHRKRIEDALRRSEERLDLALAGANEGIWDWDLENQSLHFDARYYTISGYEPDEFPAVYEEWEKRVHPDDLDQARSAMSQYLSGDLEKFDFEFRFLRKGGEYMWIQDKGKIVARNDQGDPTRFIGTHCDITERKQIEESLRITQFSFDTASIGIHLIASDARILDVNPEAARMLGYTKEELAAMSIFDIDPSGNSEIWGAIRQYSISQGPHKFEATHRRKDGSEILVEVNTNLLEYEGRQYAICFVQDITKRKQADDDLRHLRNYLSDIIDSMPSVLIGVDNEGRVTQWNRQAEMATGLTFEEANSQQLGTVIPHLMNQMAHIKNAIQERRVIRDLKVPHKQQDDVQYEDVTIFPLVANGVEGAVIRVDDVTERVRLEELMIQSEKMLSVGGLAAGMAHEINNPLAGILQNAAVLNNRLFMDLPANRTAAQAAGVSMAAIQHYMELRKLPVMIENIHNSGMRASTIVKNMLGFARKSDHTVSSHDLCKLLDKAIELIETDFNMKMNYDFKQIRVKREYDDAGTWVPGEASKLQQVFLNLLKNGAEAMAAATHGQTPPMFRLRVKGNGSWVQVEIEDNGPGMDEKTRRRVFEPFFTTKPVGKGTGLGLSVAYFIITENHGGEMEAQASENGGARFVIRLPKSGKKTAPEA